MTPLSVRILLPAVMLLGLLLLPPVATAQDHPLDQTPQTPVVDPPNLTVIELEQRWQIFRGAEAGSEQEISTFELVSAAGRELGAPSLIDHAQLLLLDAERANESGNTGRAEQLAGWAERLAPDSAEVAFYHADRIWRSEPWNLFDLSSSIIVASQASLERTPSRLILELHLWTLLWWTAIILVVGFAASQLWRYFRLASYDLASLVSHVAPARWMSVLLVSGILLPAVVFGSPFLAILLSYILVWAYQRPPERVVALILIAGLAGMPNLADRMGRLVSAASSSVSFLDRSQNELCEGTCYARLESLLDQSPSDQLVHFTVALLSARRGDPDSLRRAWDLLDSASFSAEYAPSVDLLRANIQALAGQSYGARRTFENLLTGPDLDATLATAANFNLYRVLSDLGDQPGAEARLEAARGHDHEAVIEALDPGSRRTNLWLMLPGIPPGLLYEAAIREGDAASAAAAAEIWRRVSGSLNPDQARVAVLVIGALCLFMVLVGRWMRASASCPKCGHVMSRRETPTQAEAGYCVGCYDLFMEGASLDAAERKGLEAKVDQFAQVQRQRTMVGNIVIGGGGFLLRGRVLLGTPLLALAILGGVLLFCSAPAVASSFAISTDRFDGRQLLAGVCLLVGYGGSWGLTWLQRNSL